MSCYFPLPHSFSVMDFDLVTPILTPMYYNLTEVYVFSPLMSHYDYTKGFADPNPG